MDAKIHKLTMAVYGITKQTHPNGQYECIESDFEWPDTAQTTKQIERSCSGKLNNVQLQMFFYVRCLIQFLHKHTDTDIHTHRHIKSKKRRPIEYGTSKPK